MAQQQSTRFGRSNQSAAGRSFGRSSATSSSRGRFARGTATPRQRPSTPGLRRRKPQQSGLKKVMSSVLPTGAAKKAAPSSTKGKAGSAALLAAAAGVAFKNRDKLRGSRSKGEQVSPDAAGSSNGPVTTPPSTPAV